MTFVNTLSDALRFNDVEMEDDSIILFQKFTCVLIWISTQRLSLRFTPEAGYEPLFGINCGSEEGLIEKYGFYAQCNLCVKKQWIASGERRPSEMKLWIENEMISSIYHFHYVISVTVVSFVHFSRFLELFRISWRPSKLFRRAHVCLLHPLYISVQVVCFASVWSSGNFVNELVLRLRLSFRVSETDLSSIQLLMYCSKKNILLL